MRLAHVFVSSLLFGLSSGLPAAGAEPGRLNFLWLIAEDLGPHLSCCGTKEVWTPNLDKLASEGVRYHALLHHGTRLLAQPLGVHDGDVPNHHRRASPPLAPRRWLSAPRRGACGQRLDARRRLLHGQHPHLPEGSWIRRYRQSVIREQAFAKCQFRQKGPGQAGNVTPFDRAYFSRRSVQ